MCYPNTAEAHGALAGLIDDFEDIRVSAPIQRNKKVDVPTEAWQKNIERRLAALEAK